MDNKKRLREVESEIKRLTKEKENLERIIEKEKSKYDKFFDTYAGRQIFGKYPLSEYSTWIVYGEDPNCDLGGSHHEPMLGVFEGKLEDVIRTAVDLDGFWTWGGGGRIEKHVPIKITKVS